MMVLRGTWVVVWRGFFWYYGFHTSAGDFGKFNETGKKKIMLFGVYAGMILFPRIFQF